MKKVVVTAADLGAAVDPDGDLVVTLPRGRLKEWIEEGDAAGDPPTGGHWAFHMGGHPPKKSQPGNRVYVVYEGQLIGYAPLVRIDRDVQGKGFNLVRGGDAVACTIDEPCPGFRGYKYRTWPREAERPFPDWRKLARAPKERHDHNRAKQADLSADLASVYEDLPESGPVWAWHGTSTTLLPDILEHGLDPERAGHFEGADVEQGVFLSLTGNVGFYADRAAAQTGGVLVDAAQLEPDPDDAHIPSGRSQVIHRDRSFAATHTASNDSANRERIRTWLGSLGDPLTLWRAVQADDVEAPVGIYWSAERARAQSVWVDNPGQPQALIEAQAARGAVDEQGTIRAMLRHPGEREVRLQPGAPVSVVSIHYPDGRIDDRVRTMTAADVPPDYLEDAYLRGQPAGEPLKPGGHGLIYLTPSSRVRPGQTPQAWYYARAGELLSVQLKAGGNLFDPANDPSAMSVLQTVAEQEGLDARTLDRWEKGFIDYESAPAIAAAAMPAGFTVFEFWERSVGSKSLAVSDPNLLEVTDRRPVSMSEEPPKGTDTAPSDAPAPDDNDLERKGQMAPKQWIAPDGQVHVLPVDESHASWINTHADELGLSDADWDSATTMISPLLDRGWIRVSGANIHVGNLDKVSRSVLNDVLVSLAARYHLEAGDYIHIDVEGAPSRSVQVRPSGHIDYRGLTRSGAPAPTEPSKGTITAAGYPLEQCGHEALTYSAAGEVRYLAPEATPAVVTMQDVTAVTAAMLDAPPAMLEAATAALREALEWATREYLAKQGTKIEKYYTELPDQIEQLGWDITTLGSDVTDLKPGARGHTVYPPELGAAGQSRSLSIQQDPDEAYSLWSHTGYGASSEQVLKGSREEAESKLQLLLENRHKHLEQLLDVHNSDQQKSMDAARDEFAETLTAEPELGSHAAQRWATFTISVDLTGWRYEAEVDASKLPETVTLSFYARSGQNGTQGTWYGGGDHMTIFMGDYYADNARGFDTQLANFTGTVEHELAHGAQDYLEMGKELPHPAGLPSGTTENGAQPTPHAQRPVEFYPNLISETRAFQRNHGDLPPAERQQKAHEWINGSRFQEVRQVDEHRWQKMVTEFMRAVTASSRQARTLWHGTSSSAAQSIVEDQAIMPQVGPWVESSYGCDYGGAENAEFGAEFPGTNWDITFAADKSDIGKALGGIVAAVAAQLGKQFHDVSDQDIRAHGALVKVEEGDSYMEQRPHGDDPDLEWEARQESEGLAPTIEPGDWYSMEPQSPDAVLSGDKMVTVLRQFGVWPRDWGPDAQRNQRELLIKQVRQQSPERTLPEIVERIDRLSPSELLQMLRQYQRRANKVVVSTSDVALALDNMADDLENAQQDYEVDLQAEQGQQFEEQQQQQQHLGAIAENIWIEPNGARHSVGRSHDDWAHEQGTSLNELLDLGWVRVAPPEAIQVRTLAGTLDAVKRVARELVSQYPQSAGVWVETDEDNLFVARLPTGRPDFSKLGARTAVGYEQQHHGALQRSDFVPSPGAATHYQCDRVIWCDPMKLEAAWKKSLGSTFIERDGENAVPGRLARFATFLKGRDAPIHMPYGNLDRGEFSFCNGRHRARFLINAGREVPVSVPAADYDELSRRLAADEPVKQLATWRGLLVCIEVPGGGVRFPEGPHTTFIPPDWVGYGYFDDMPAEDGDSLDVIVGPHEFGEVYLAIQKDIDTGEFVQYKVMIGFESEVAAAAGYRLLWPVEMYGGIFTIPLEEFRDIVLEKLVVDETPTIDEIASTDAEADASPRSADDSAPSTPSQVRDPFEVEVPASQPNSQGSIPGDADGADRSATQLTRQAEYASRADRAGHLVALKRIYELEYKTSQLNTAEQLTERTQLQQSQMRAELARLVTTELAYLKEVVTYWYETHMPPAEWDVIHGQLEYTGRITQTDNVMAQGRMRVIKDMRAEIALALVQPLEEYIKEHPDEDEDEDDGWSDEMFLLKRLHALRDVLKAGDTNAQTLRSLWSNIQQLAPGDTVEEAVWAVDGGLTAEGAKEWLGQLHEEVGAQPTNARVKEMLDSVSAVTTSTPLGEQVAALHYAVTTAHNNGPMATRAYGLRATDALAALSEAPDPQWSEEMTSLMTQSGPGYAPPSTSQLDTLTLAWRREQLEGARQRGPLADAAELELARLNEQLAETDAVFAPNRAVPGGYAPTDEDTRFIQQLLSMPRGGATTRVNLEDLLATNPSLDTMVKPVGLGFAPMPLRELVVVEVDEPPMSKTPPAAADASSENADDTTPGATPQLRRDPFDVTAADLLEAYDMHVLSTADFRPALHGGKLLVPDRTVFTVAGAHYPDLDPMYGLPPSDAVSEGARDYDHMHVRLKPQASESNLPSTVFVTHAELDEHFDVTTPARHQRVPATAPQQVDLAGRPGRRNTDPGDSRSGPQETGEPGELSDRSTKPERVSARTPRRVRSGVSTHQAKAVVGDACPHCGEVMTEKSIYGGGERWFHRPCSEKGPIERTADSAGWWVSPQGEWIDPGMLHREWARESYEQYNVPFVPVQETVSYGTEDEEDEDDQEIELYDAQEMRPIDAFFAAGWIRVRGDSIGAESKAVLNTPVGRAVIKQLAAQLSGQLLQIELVGDDVTMEDRYINLVTLPSGRLKGTELQKLAGTSLVGAWISPAGKVFAGTEAGSHEQWIALNGPAHGLEFSPDPSQAQAPEDGFFEEEEPADYELAALQRDSEGTNAYIRALQQGWTRVADNSGLEVWTPTEQTLALAEQLSAETGKTEIVLEWHHPTFDWLLLAMDAPGALHKRSVADLRRQLNQQRQADTRTAAWIVTALRKQANKRLKTLERLTGVSMPETAVATIKAADPQTKKGYLTWAAEQARQAAVSITTPVEPWALDGLIEPAAGRVVRILAPAVDSWNVLLAVGEGKLGANGEFVDAAGDQRMLLPEALVRGIRDGSMQFVDFPTLWSNLEVGERVYADGQQGEIAGVSETTGAWQVKTDAGETIETRDPQRAELRPEDAARAQATFTAAAQALDAFDEVREFAETKELKDIATVAELQEVADTAQKMWAAEPRKERAKYEQLSPQIIRFDNKDAACLIAGGATDWCFAKWNQSYWETYTANGNTMYQVTLGAERYGVALAKGGAIVELRNAANDDVDSDEQDAVVEAFSEAGIEVAAGGEWQDLDFTPDEAAEWQGADFDDPHVAAEWRNHGIEPTDAADWDAIGRDAATAAAFASDGVTPQIVERAYALGVFRVYTDEDAVPVLNAAALSALEQHYPKDEEGRRQVPNNVIHALVGRDAEALSLSEAIGVGEIFRDADETGAVAASGLDYEEIMTWIDLATSVPPALTLKRQWLTAGVPLDVAIAWRSGAAAELDEEETIALASMAGAVGYDASDVDTLVAWNQIGVRPRAAMSWGSRGFTPETAEAWIEAGWASADDASRQRGKGLSHSDELGWERAIDDYSFRRGVDYAAAEAEVAEWRAAGLDIQVAVDWASTAKSLGGDIQSAIRAAQHAATLPPAEAEMLRTYWYSHQVTNPAWLDELPAFAAQGRSVHAQLEWANAPGPVTVRVELAQLGMSANIYRTLTVNQSPEAILEQARANARQASASFTHAPEILGYETPVEFEFGETKDDKTEFSQAGSEYKIWVPTESVPQIQSDLEGRVPVDMQPDSGNEAVDAVIRGEGELLGKGDDGIVWKVGDQVVKMSTVVPYQPLNPFHRTPEAAADMLAHQTDVAAALSGADVPGIMVPETVRHGEKAFQVRPHVEIPERLTPEELAWVGDAVDQMHSAGYAMHDQLQVGKQPDGSLVFFDIGKAGLIESTDSFFGDRNSDEDSLRMLYSQSEQPYVPGGAFFEQAWQTVVDHAAEAATFPAFLQAEEWALIDQALAQGRPEATQVARVYEQAGVPKKAFTGDQTREWADGAKALHSSGTPVRVIHKEERGPGIQMYLVEFLEGPREGQRVPASSSALRPVGTAWDQAKKAAVTVAWYDVADTWTARTERIAHHLTAGRLEDVKKKYPHLAHEIGVLAAADPSDNQKYLAWAAKQLHTEVADYAETWDVDLPEAANRSDLEETAELIAGLLPKFHKRRKRLEKKDINQYASRVELRDALEAAGHTKSEIKEAADYGIVHEDEYALIAQIKNKEAAALLGTGTDWCISKYDQKHFENYEAQGVEFYFILGKEYVDRAGIMEHAAEMSQAVMAAYGDEPSSWAAIQPNLDYVGAAFAEGGAEEIKGMVTQLTWAIADDPPMRGDEAELVRALRRGSAAAQKLFYPAEKVAAALYPNGMAEYFDAGDTSLDGIPERFRAGFDKAQPGLNKETTHVGFYYARIGDENLDFAAEDLSAVDAWIERSPTAQLYGVSVYCAQVKSGVWAAVQANGNFSFLDEQPLGDIRVVKQVPPQLHPVQILVIGGRGVAVLDTPADLEQYAAAIESQGAEVYEGPAPAIEVQEGVNADRLFQAHGAGMQVVQRYPAGFRSAAGLQDLQGADDRVGDALAQSAVAVMQAELDAAEAKGKSPYWMRQTPADAGDHLAERVIDGAWKTLDVLHDSVTLGELVPVDLQLQDADANRLFKAVRMYLASNDQPGKLAYFNPSARIVVINVPRILANVLQLGRTGVPPLDVLSNAFAGPVAHELRHAADWAYQEAAQPHRFEERVVDTMGAGSSDEYVNSPHELIAIAGSVAHRLYGLVGDAWQTMGGTELLSWVEDGTLHLVRPENRPDFLRRMVKGLEQLTAQTTRKTLEQWDEEDTGRAAKIVISAGDLIARVRKKLPPKGALWSMLLRESGIDYPADFVAADAAFQAWDNQWASQREPKPVYEGGETDAINSALDLEGKRRVSGTFEGFLLLTRGITTWHDFAASDALEVLAGVPGLEELRLPEAVTERFLDEAEDADAVERTEEFLETEPDESPILPHETLAPDALDFDTSRWARVGVMDLQAQTEHESAVIVLRVPGALARMFPKDLAEENGPPHFTLAYIPGPHTDLDRQEIRDVAESVARGTPKIPVELERGVHWFTSDVPETQAAGEAEIAHKTVHPETAERMAALHWALVEALEARGFKPAVRKEFKVHSTLAYCPTRSYDGPVPEGGWTADALEVWGEADTYGFELAGARPKKNVWSFKQPSPERQAVFDELAPHFETAKVVVGFAREAAPGFGQRGPGRGRRRGPVRRKKRFVGETYYVRLGGRDTVGYTTPDHIDGEAEGVRLCADARILKEGDADWLQLFEEGLPKLTDIIQKAVTEGYDAVRIGEALAILSGVAIAERDSESTRKRREQRKRDRLGWTKVRNE